MKKHPDDDAMSREVDFTGGIRGKYADRYREGVSIRETTSLDPITIYETQSRLGHALWQAQSLEAACVAYLSLVQELEVREAGARVHDLLEHHTSEKHTNHVWRSLLEFDDLADRLRKIVPERNWIVHRCTFELANLTEHPNRAPDITLRLELFADEAQYLSQSLLKVIESHLSHAGVPSKEIATRTMRVIQAWANA